ncbi:37S ribosomal protein S22 [Stygiomarasmius scandens]|uniref:37S ribosomal protein S22 n=1 Tax=Marasmiellus scandens TaxID=2682957 RepID=A0ABR1IZ38_9AGAR
MLKSGYRKIWNACLQALEDGLPYIWVDTCCIEQGNHDEVARNITSMYAYYQEAKICYAYLVDVDFNVSPLESYDARLEFGLSVWFDRGWTLQELLAPSEVLFFNKEWFCIGSKVELRTMVCGATSIPTDVLSGQRPVHNVDPAQRMSWAMGRETTKPQDQAYCLQGLLGVSIDPNYEEGVEQSFLRLRSSFLDAHPEHKESLGAVKDLYQFLNYTRHASSSHGGSYPISRQQYFRRPDLETSPVNLFLPSFLPRYHT